MDNIIFDLIANKREGVYWDFKRKHHDNKAKLLHDILCFANALSKKDKFLIYGVSDPSEGADIVGVPDEHRRTQADLIDFIGAQNFAGENSPEIELRTIAIDEKQIDILVIFDRPNKPYYLAKDYRSEKYIVRANYIYSRVADVNTPIDRSSDVFTIENMWKERFGIDLQPIEKMLALLRDHTSWEKDIGNRGVAYNMINSEFHLKFGPVSEIREMYSYFYANKKSFTRDVSFFNGSTELFVLPFLYCDEMRLELPLPQCGYITSDLVKIDYFYYEVEGKEGAFLEFLTNGNFNFKSRMCEAPFILFKDYEHRQRFEKYILNNPKKVAGMKNNSLGKKITQEIEKDSEDFITEPSTLIKLKSVFLRWNEET